MTTPKRLLEPTLKTLAEELGAAPMRLLSSILDVAQPDGDPPTLLRADKAPVLEALAAQEQKAPDTAALRQRIRQINAALKGLGPRPPFSLRSSKPAFIIELSEGFLKRRRGEASAVLARRSAEQDARVEHVETPVVKSRRVFADGGSLTDEDQAILRKFLDDLEHKLQYPPEHYTHLGDIELWSRDKRLRSTTGSTEDALVRAARGAEAGLVVLSHAWRRDSASQAALQSFARGGRLEHRRLVKVRLNADRYEDAELQVSHPLKTERFDSLFAIYEKGDRYDKDSFATVIADELFAALDEAAALRPVDLRRTTADLERHDPFVRLGKEEDPHAAEREENDATPILPVLEAWVREDEAEHRVTALLGDFGAGKTTTCQCLVRRLLDSARPEGEEDGPLPVYLDLRRLAEFYRPDASTPLSLPELVKRSLNLGEVHGLDVEGLLEIIRTQRSVVIFDGLDEVGNRVGPERAEALFRQLLEIVPREAWARDRERGRAHWACPTRLLVSCRTHFFRDHAVEQSVLSARGRVEAGLSEGGRLPLKSYYMAPFTPDQVRSVLVRIRGEEEGRRIFALVDRNGQLSSLARRPIMARFVAEVSEHLEADAAEGRILNAGRVYQLLFRQVLERDGDKQPLLTVPDREDLLSELAFHLWTQRTPALPIDQLERWFDSYARGHEGMQLLLASGSNTRRLLHTELRNASLLVRDAGEAEFRFVHTSFQEYFLAAAIHRRLLDGRLAKLESPPSLSEETIHFLADLSAPQPAALGRPLGQLLEKGGSRELRQLAVELRLRLAQRGMRYPLEAGADLSELELRGSTLMTLTETRPLSGVSLAGARCFDADWEGLHFSGCDFEGTELAGARMARCRFDHCGGRIRGGATARALRCTESGGSVLDALGHRIEASSPPGENPRVFRLPLRLGPTHAVFAPDGTEVLTANWDGTARVWDATTGEERLRLEGHLDSVTSAVYAPDGSRVLTASWDGTTREWDATTGQERIRLEGHGGWVTNAVYDPDGKRVLTASWDATARVWDATTGQERLRLEGHLDSVTSAVYAPDGTRVLTASEDGTARVWDASTGQERLRLGAHRDEVRSAIFAPDGTRVLTADDRTARVWDATTGQDRLRFEGHEDEVRSAVYAPDGTRVLTASSDRAARVWDATTGEERLRLEGHRGAVMSAVYAPDGTRVLTTSWDETMRVWDGTTGEERLRLEGHGNGVTSAVYAPDGTRVLTASSDRTARVWDATTGQEQLRIEGHLDAVKSAVYAPDGTRVLTASNDGTARVWDATTGQERLRLEVHGSAVTSAVYAPNGTRVLTSSDDGTARVWDATTGQERLRLEGHGRWVTSAVYAPDGTRVLTASLDGTARVWDASTGQERLRLKGHGSPVESAVYAPDGTRVLTASYDGTARVWDATTGQEQLRLEGHGRTVASAVYAPDGTRVLTASHDGTVRVWDATTGQERLRLQGHLGGVTSAVYAPDGTRILTAPRDGTARVWDAATGAPILSVVGLPDGYAVLGPDDQVVAGSATIWKYLDTREQRADGRWWPVSPTLEELERITGSRVE